jgi:hypothetical protein
VQLLLAPHTSLVLARMPSSPLALRMSALALRMSALALRMSSSAPAPHM